jgi:hypothetical protein
MTGRPLLSVTARDRSLLSEVMRFGVMSREQLVRLKFFSSKTRANERLKKLVVHGYLTCKRQALTAGGPRHIYLPGPALENTHGARKRFAEASDLFVAHQLGLVDIRLTFEQHRGISRWLSDRELAVLKLPVIPDAYVEFELAGQICCAFIEYDRGTETLARFERKVRSYLEFAYSGAFERAFKRRFFRLLVIVESGRRLSTLSVAVVRITDKIVRFTTLEQFLNDGPPASIWRRPGAQGSESLIT